MELRPYQAAAVDAIMRDLDECDRTMLVLATGCGKTRTAAEVVRRFLDRGRVLWIAHREELITQARDALQRALPGVPIGIEQAGSYARVSALPSLSDRVVVASVQTLHEKRLSRFAPSLFGLVVVDEAHHSAASSYRRVVDYFGTKVLGLTATPDRGDGIGMGEVFTRVSHEYGMQRAIAEGYLSPIRAVCVDVAGLDLSSVRTTAGDLNQGQLARLLEVDSLHHQIASPLVQLAGDRSTIVFCTSVEQSSALSDVIQGYLPPGRQVRHIDGGTPGPTRRRILREYESGDVQVVCNVGVLTEGFDAPRTSCIALARPTKSRALYAQMVGRGTRLFGGKDDCLLVDFRGNAGRHSLANPIDLLAGKPLPDDVRADLERRVKDGKILDVDAIADAEAEHAKRIEAADRKRAAAAKVQVQAKAQITTARDLFRNQCGPGDAQSRTPATAAQRAQLVTLGVPEDDVRNLSSDQAHRMVDKLVMRRRAGLCTYKQARLLARNGLRSDLKFEEARVTIDALVANKWRPTADLTTRYGIGAQ